MKKAEAVDGQNEPPRRRSRKSVYCTDGQVKRSSSRLTSQGSASSKPDPGCQLLKNSSKEKTSSTEDRSNKEVPTCIVSYTGRRGKRQRETQATGSTDGNQAQTSHSQAKIRSKLNFRSSDLEVVARTSGKEDSTNGDQSGDLKRGKVARKLCVSLPPNAGMDNVANTRTRYRRGCKIAHRDRAQVPGNETGKSELHDLKAAQSPNNETAKTEMGLQVAISRLSEVCAKALEKNNTAESDDKTVEVLRNMVTDLTGIADMLAHIMVQNLQEGKLQSMQAEKAEFEAFAIAELHKLRDEITRLKQKNQTVNSENLLLKRERDRLKKDYARLLDKTKDVEKLQVERDIAEASSAALTEELSKEQDKSSCQICFNTPRDAVILPCMHFQYCNDCLQKHQRQNTDCPTCRGKINGVFRCKF